MMIVLPFIALFKIARRLTDAPEFRGLAALEIALIMVGAIFYHNVEQWSWLDSVYFCVVTLATVGYGDFTPTTTWGRLFAIPYIILGVAMLGVFIQIAGRTALEELQEHEQKRQLKEQAKREQEAEENRNAE